MQEIMILNKIKAAWWATKKADRLRNTGLGNSPRLEKGRMEVKMKSKWWKKRKIVHSMKKQY